MFKLENLNVSYGKKNVLTNINLNIKFGEVVAIVGESACGKSTLISQLQQLKPLETAWCPQHANLVPSLSAFHNIYAGTLNEHNFLYNLRNLIHPYQDEFKKVHNLASKLGIQNELKISVDQLSGGQIQRVNIARAMIQKHAIFLGDEPVSALDDFHKVNVIKAITAQFKTCIFVLHDLNVAMACCQRIIGIANGGIIFDEQVNNISKQQLAQVFSHHYISLDSASSESDTL